MECAEVREALPELLTGDGKLKASIEEHLLRCEACRRDVAEVRRVLDIVQKATDVHGTEAVPPFEELLARVRSRRRALPRLLARAAALLLAGLVGAAADRLLVRDHVAPGDESLQASIARDDARRALAERPGGLGSSLAVLRALSLDPRKR